MDKNSSALNTEDTFLIRADRLSLRRGSFALSEVSLIGEPHEIILLLGQNGAGKSSLLRILAGLLEPQSGTIIRHHRGTSLVSHDSMMYGGLTTQQNLELLCSLNGQALPQESISKWGLSEHLHTRTSLLSRGLTTRLSLVRALTSQAQLLLFDEPTSNLDDSSTNLFIDTVSAKVTERCVAIIATHDISRLLPVASRVLVLGRGTIVADSGSGGDISEALDIYHRLNR